MNVRIEHDLLGEREVPSAAYWGIHTLRACENFPLSGRPVRPELVRALARVKQACIRANGELGYLPPGMAAALDAAAEEIASGAMADQFPADALQGGAGTSLHMNMNEVLANRALERLGAARGDYARLHPNDHVNLHQSTNDVVPTAVRVAAAQGLHVLAEEFAALQGVFQRLEKAFAGIVAIGRTELQEAVPLTLGAEFSGFAEAFSRDRWRVFKCVERVRVVNLGGTAVGTGLAAPRRFIFLAIERLRDITGLGLARAENLVDGTAHADALAEVSGILESAACNFIKIAGDLRLLHLLGEIRLPAAQAGSSIMPGKVNPVICEAVTQGALRVRAHHAELAGAVSRGSLQLNEFMPLIADALLSSIALLSAMARMLARHAEGIEASAGTCAEYAGRSITLITALLPRIGYARAQEIARAFAASGRTDARRFLEEQLGADAVAAALNPAALTALGYDDEREGQG